MLSENLSPAGARSRGTRIERCLVWMLAGLVCAFYFWTVAPESPRLLAQRENASYYNLLVRGLLKGQLALDVPADPFLATLANPYDPGQRAGHGLHDASYYKGKYYIYFGLTPVLVLFLPAKVLTGWFVSENLAVLLFSAAGFLVTVVLLHAIARRLGAGAGGGLLVAGVLVLGLATMVPPLLRRPAMWEIPISCGYFFFMLTLYALWQTMERGGRKKWLALASLAMGLCVGARPVYLLGSVCLLAPLAWAAQTAGRDFWRQRRWWQLAACAAGPIMAVGLGLALYNYLRFENPLEFGQTYQMAGEDVTRLKLFSLGYIPYNLRIYFLSAPGLTPYFPFLTVINPPAAPAGQFGVEDPYGVLPGMPWVLFAVAGLALAWRPRHALAWWCAATWAGVVATTLFICCFGGATGRYEVDFTPGLVLLGAVGVMALAGRLRGPVGRRLLTGAAWLLALWSAGFNVLASLQHNRLLMLNHPQVYAPVAHAANRLSAGYDWLTGMKYGPIELRVNFPRDALGQVEPLVVTGREFLADYLYVHYAGVNEVRFGFEHTSRGGGVGLTVKIDPAVEHMVLVQMGSLYPPVDHPASDGLSRDELRERQRTVQVYLDGKIVLFLNALCYDATSRTPSLGTSGPNCPGFKRDFSGRILGWRRVPPLPVNPQLEGFGPLRLELKLPEFSGRTSEPLLCSGETGRGDLVYLVRLDERHVAIGHDRWGYGGARSESIELDPSALVEMEISCPPLLPPGSPEVLQVKVAGRVVLAETGPYYPSRPDQVVVGANPIGSSMGSEVFHGTVITAERLQPK